jgi:hypothetical protein
MTKERRTAPRHSVKANAHLDSRDGKDRVRVLNVSRTGVMIETAAELAMGERIRVIADGAASPHQLNLSGTVVWRSTTLAGLKFDVALSEEDLKALVG